MISKFVEDQVYGAEPKKLTNARRNKKKSVAGLSHLQREILKREGREGEGVGAKCIVQASAYGLSQ